MTRYSVCMRQHWARRDSAAARRDRCIRACQGQPVEPGGLSKNFATGNVIERVSIPSLYPNPATNNLNVELYSVSKNTATVIITNTLGQVVLKYQFNNIEGANKHDIDISSLNSGMYMVNIEYGNTSNTQKIQVSKE